jgi:hypothetical protein
MAKIAARFVGKEHLAVITAHAVHRQRAGVDVDPGMSNRLR